MRGKAIGASALAAAAVWSSPALSSVVPAVAGAFDIRRRLDRPGIALTFDDGPHPEGTPAVLELLALSGASATFFLVGEQVERYPSLAAEIAAAGHEIALHGYAHTLLLRRTPRALERDLDRAVAVIEDATGRSPACYRPPYGIFSSAGVALARRRGWAPTLWSRWGRDWGARETPERIARRASSGLVSGDVILLHDADYYSSRDCWRRMVLALPTILEAAIAVGEPLVAVTPPASSG
jgi:peptidoglycan/xylan/chitin deacetylase (PgdA/CDA1 family)